MKVKNSLLILSIVLVSCNPGSNITDLSEYTKDMDNGLHKIIEVDKWNYDIQYKPSKLILAQENLQSEDAKSARTKQLEGTVWFNITIKRSGENANPLKYQVSGQDEYNARLDYFLNAAQKEIKLSYGNTVLLPISYLFENNYGLTPNETMIIGFELPGEKYPQKDMTLEYNDVLFKNGIVKAFFKKEAISKVN